MSHAAPDDRRSSPDPAALPPATGPSAVGAARRGARAGARGMAVVALPLGIALLTATLAPTAFGLGAGRGLGVHPAAPAVVGGCIGVELAAGLLGGLLGGGRALLRRPAGRAPAPAHPGPARPPRPRPRRWGRWLAIPAALALVAAAGLGAYAGRAVDRRLAGAIAAADRADPGWRLADLLARRAALPLAANSAPVVAEVAALLPGDWPPGPAAGPVAAACAALDAAPANVGLDPAAVAALGAELDRLAAAVARARTLADGRPGRLPLADAGAGDPVAAVTRWARPARSVARLLAADAALRGAGGDPDAALDSCRAILGVARSGGDEPFLVAGLVRIAVGRAGLRAARRVLGQGEPTDAALARLQALLLDERARPSLRDEYRGERALGDAATLRLRAGAIGGGGGGDPTPAAGPVPPWDGLALDHQRAVALEWMGEVVAIGGRPAADRPALFRAREAELAGAQATFLGRLVAPAPPGLAAPWGVAADAHARYEAEVGATILLLAAERHRRRHGAWPASVAALDPAILPDPPRDPSTGLPFAVEVADSRFLVRSAGPPGRDGRGAGGPDDAGAAGWDVPLRRRPPAAGSGGVGSGGVDP